MRIIKISEAILDRIPVPVIIINDTYSTIVAHEHSVLLDLHSGTRIAYNRYGNIINVFIAYRIVGSVISIRDDGAFVV